MVQGFGWGWDSAGHEMIGWVKVKVALSKIAISFSFGDTFDDYVHTFPQIQTASPLKPIS